jgi:hypothetical protein
LDESFSLGRAGELDELGNQTLLVPFVFVLLVFLQLELAFLALDLQCEVGSAESFLGRGLVGVEPVFECVEDLALQLVTYALSDLLCRAPWSSLSGALAA